MSVLDPDPRSLLVVQAVVRTGSLSAAARELGWTHPAVAAHIRRLEATLGTVLIERHGRGVTPTAAGRALAAAGAEIAATLATARARVAALAQGMPRLRVAAFPTACATLLVDAVGALATGDATVGIDIRQAEPDEALTALDAGETDVAVTFHDRRPTDPRATVLGIDRSIVARPLDPHGTDASEAVVALAALDGAAVIAGCPACRARFVAHCAEHGVRPRVHHQVTDDYVLMQSLVAAGQGAAVLPALALVAHRRDDVSVAVLEPALERFVAVWVAPRAAGSDAELLVAALRQRATSLLAAA